MVSKVDGTVIGVSSSEERSLDPMYTLILPLIEELVATCAGWRSKIACEETVYEEPKKLAVADSHITLEVWLKKLTRPNARGDFVVPNISQDSFHLLLSIFMIYPEFGPMYDSYLESPDKNIQLRVEGAEAETIKSNVQCSSTLDNFRITAHLLIVLMSKPVSTDRVQRSNGIRSFVEKRKEAARLFMNSPQAEFCLNLEGVENMPDIWNSVPVLKRKVLYWVLQNHPKYTELKTAALLVAEFSMINIKCITDFITMPVCSHAHHIPQICREATKFLKTVTTMKKEMGILWPFYRVLKPLDKKLEISNFPNLSETAFAFCGIFVNRSEIFHATEFPRPSVPFEFIFCALSNRDEELFYFKSQQQDASHETVYKKLLKDQRRAQILLTDLRRWIPSDQQKAILLLDEMLLE